MSQTEESSETKNLNSFEYIPNLTGQVAFLCQADTKHALYTTRQPESGFGAFSLGVYFARNYTVVENVAQSLDMATYNIHNNLLFKGLKFQSFIE